MVIFAAPSNAPAPLSPLVPLNSPMVGAASPFTHSDGQNRDIILESIRAWASLNLLTWSSAWQSFFTTWLPAAEAYINTNAVTGHSWRTTATPISTTLPTLVTVLGVTTAAPLAIGDLIVDSTADSNYGIVTAVADTSHATVTFIGFLHGVAGPNSLPADTAVAGFISTTGSSLTKTALINRAIILNVGDYGAIGDGITDDTAAIQTAYNALPAVGGTLTGRGTFLVSTFALWTKSVVFQGVGRYATIFKTTSAAGDVFTLNGKGSGFNNVGFDSAPTRSAGAFIKIISMSYGAITDVHLAHYYIGIDIDNTTGYNITNISALDGTPSSVVAGGGIIRLGKTAYTGGINIRGVLANVNVAANQPSYGINLGFVDVISINGVLIIHHGTNLLITPDTGQTASLITCTDSCFDTAQRGMVISPTGSGLVTRCSFANTWFGAHTADGIQIFGTAPAKINEITFLGCMFHANSQIGANVTGAGVNGVYFNSCFAAANGGNGMQITTTALDIRVTGGALGAVAGLVGNGNSGLATDATSTGVMSGVKLDGNTGPRISITSTGFDTDEWRTFTGVVTAESGAITAATNTINYSIIGQTVNFTATVTVATNGTGAGAVNVTLPYVPAGNAVVSGRETALSGKGLQGNIVTGTAFMRIYFYDGTYPGANGNSLTVSGTYRRT